MQSPGPYFSDSSSNLRQRVKPAEDETSAAAITASSSSATASGSASVASSSKPGPAAPHPLNVLAHVRDLFAQPRVSGFTSLDGLRAVLCLWMIAFHSFFFRTYFAPDPELRALSNHPALAWLLLGYLPVDGFFILTGFLLATPFFLQRKKALQQNPESEGKVEFSLKDWYFRRLARMIPVYFGALFLFCRFLFPEGLFNLDLLLSNFQKNVTSYFPAGTTHFPTECHLTPFNIFFVNNLLPFGGCMGWSWSLAVQSQFYLALPLMWKWVGGSGRHLHRFLWLCVGGSLLLAVFFRVYAFYQAVSFDVHTVEGVFISFFWYANTLTRSSVIMLGVLGAHLHVNTNFAAWIKSHSLVRRVCWAICIAVLIVQIRWSAWFSNGNLFETPGVQAIRGYKSGFSPLLQLVFHAFLMVGSPLSGAIFLYFIFMLVNSADGFAGRAARALSKRFWYPIAQLSYLSYLLHPAFLVLGYATVFYPPPSTWFNVYFMALLFIAVTMVCCFVLHVLFEKPCDIYLRSGKHPILSKIVFVYCCILMLVSVITHLGLLYKVVIVGIPDGASTPANAP